MKKRMVLVQHYADLPPDDRVVTWCYENGVKADIRCPCDGDALPQSVEPDLLGSVIYGGPYDAYAHEAHPFLLQEQDWIATCMAAGLPLLGICQGAQQIAFYLGAEVGAPGHGQHEFGVYALDSLEAGFMLEGLHVPQAHFHGFGLPAGATRLASTPFYPQQAVRFNATTYGFQFHAEQTIESFRRWQRDFTHHAGKPGVQEKAEQDRLLLAHDETTARWFYAFLDDFFGARLEP